jgi:hypothetical protein
MVNLLVLSQSLVHLGLQSRARPQDAPIPLLILSKTIVFQGIPNDFDVTFVKLEVVASIWRLVRPDTYWILVWSED